VLADLEAALHSVSVAEDGKFCQFELLADGIMNL
jgi:hypothetical protein